MSHKPLVVICGTTGVGKSKLAVDLALRFIQGELSREWRHAKVINADAMQVYKGLDVLTNKIPLEERHGVEHLLMDFKKPGEQYVVGEWVQDAIQLIQDMHERHEVPVVVGGTSYWLQHLIFPNRLSSRPANSCDTLVPSTSHARTDAELQNAIENLSSNMRRLLDHLPDNVSAANDSDLALSLHSLLTLLDPVVAGTWHWRDTRKVLRSLAIIKETGQRPSSIYQRQSLDSQQPRYRTLCFWLFATMDDLDPRLCSRVDDMLRRGLLEEVEQLQSAASHGTSSASGLDFTKGIYQSIGFREFSDYLDDTQPSQMDTALQNMKISTRQYAKRQVSWLRNKLIPAIYAAQDGSNKSPQAFLLDATDLNKWDTNVSDQAAKIMQDFMSGLPLPDPLSLSEVAHSMLQNSKRPTDPVGMLAARRRMICPTCTVDEAQPVMLLEGSEWAAHQRSKVHRKLVARALRQPESIA